MLWVADVAVRRLALPWGRIGARLAAALRRRPQQPAGRKPRTPAWAGLPRGNSARQPFTAAANARRRRPNRRSRRHAPGSGKPERSVRLRRPAPRRRARAARAGGKGPGRLRRGRANRRRPKRSRRRTSGPRRWTACWPRASVTRVSCAPPEGIAAAS